MLINVKVENDSCRCHFLKENFFRHDQTTSAYDERLDLVFISTYLKRINSLTGINKDILKVLFMMIEEQIEEILEQALHDHANSFTNVVLCLKDKLFFDSKTQTHCKTLLFKFLFNHPEKFISPEASAEVKYNQCKLYLDCIEEQLDQCPKQQRLKIMKILQIAKDQHEKAMQCLYVLSSIAKTCIENQGFYIFMKPKITHNEFWMQLGKLYDFCQPILQSFNLRQTRQ